METFEKMWTMKVSDSNRRFLYSICEKKDETYNSAITKIIEVVRPIFSKRSRIAVNCNKMNKKRVFELPVQKTPGRVLDNVYKEAEV